MIKNKISGRWTYTYLSIFCCLFLSVTTYSVDTDCKTLPFGTKVPSGDPGIYRMVCKDANSYTYNTFMTYVSNNIENFLGSSTAGFFCIGGGVVILYFYNKNNHFKKVKINNV